MRKKRSPLLLILVASLLLLPALTACQKSSPDVTPAATAAPGADMTPAPANAAPTSLVIKTALRPAIDPACLEDKGGFALTSAPLPDGGLEPGMVHVFCATGVPAGETVTFTLKSPDGQEQSFQVPSVDQGSVAAAVQAITIGADAAPGQWTLTAAWQEQEDAITFDVRPASQPFIVLAEPVTENPSVIRVAVGGLPPHAMARFGIYRIQPGQTQGDVSMATGQLLLDNLIQVDGDGRADLSLDVADQPGGPYLLSLLPADGSAEASAVIELPAQERTALAVNIQRQEPGPGVAETNGQQPSAATSQNPLPAPQLTEASGGLPDAITLALPAASLPACSPTTAPTVQLWPQSGEVGQWWYGCASGFTPDKALRVDATLGDGVTTTFDLTKTDADGVKSFRWYSLPEEGGGDFSVSVSDLTGNQAAASWTISPATRPHLLVYPHVVLKDVGAQLALTQFPKRTNVQVGIYKIDDAGAATLVKKISLKMDKKGTVQKSFDAVNDLASGTYMAVAQSSPTYQFPGIDTPATDIEFFSVGAPLDEMYEAYSLFVGRQTASPVASETSGETTTPAAETSAGQETTPAASSGVPATVTIPADNSASPTCPGAQAGVPTICMTPDTAQRATYVYMLMQDFKPGTKFVVTVTPPKGAAVKFSVQADASGLADAHWYALNDDPLGTYKVRIRGGGEKFTGAFKVVKATAPHVTVQPRSPKPGTPVIISFSGMKPKTTYVLARYRSTGEANGQIQFELLDTVKMSTGKGGGAKKSFATTAADADSLFLAAVYEENGSQPLAREVYAPGQTLYLRYPFAWAGTAP